MTASATTQKSQSLGHTSPRSFRFSIQVAGKRPSAENFARALSGALLTEATISEISTGADLFGIRLTTHLNRGETESNLCAYLDNIVRAAAQHCRVEPMNVSMVMTDHGDTTESLIPFERLSKPLVLN